MSSHNSTIPTPDPSTFEKSDTYISDKKVPPAPKKGYITQKI
jgi:hypothetical protein